MVVWGVQKNRTQRIIFSFIYIYKTWENRSFQKFNLVTLEEINKKINQKFNLVTLEEVNKKKKKKNHYIYIYIPAPPSERIFKQIEPGNAEKATNISCRV
jgi:hypothetical protein